MKTKVRSVGAFFIWIANLTSVATAQSSCSAAATPRYPAPSVAPGWEATLVATGLSEPRTIRFDSKGNLLVVQQKVGVTSHVVRYDDTGCVGLTETKEIIGDDSLNHGLELSPDGRTLYASSSESVWKWPYDPEARETSGDRIELVNGMSRRGHSTRNLLLSKENENRLLVHWGSQSNIDEAALDVASGVSQIKMFDIANVSSPLNYASEGLLLGWGLRNSVGMAEHPTTGGVFSVENSADEVERAGIDIHQNNPGEELNYHGILNITEAGPDGRNHGYPRCLAAWDLTEFPDGGGSLQVGSQFAMGDQTDTSNDAVCANQTVPPRITFAAHMAPLDIKFNNSGNEAWVSFHGSWNRDAPIGYKVSVIKFSNGMPIEPPNSTTAAVDIMTNPEITGCPDGCFRPTGLAFDSQGRLFMSSDSTGEIWVIRKTTPSTEIPAPSGTATESSPTASQTGAGIRMLAIPYSFILAALSLSFIYM